MYFLYEIWSSYSSDYKITDFEMWHHVFGKLVLPQSVRQIPLPWGWKLHVSSETLLHYILEDSNFQI